METAQEPKDPAPEGRLLLTPGHDWVVCPQAQPVTLAEGRHLLAEVEKEREEAERGAHGLQVAQVHGSLDLENSGHRKTGMEVGVGGGEGTRTDLWSKASSGRTSVLGWSQHPSSPKALPCTPCKFKEPSGVTRIRACPHSNAHVPDKGTEAQRGLASDFLRSSSKFSTWS